MADDATSVGIAYIGDQTTLAMAVKATRDFVSLLDIVAKTVAETAKTDGPAPMPVAWQPQEIVFWDGKDRPETRERVAECTDACAKQIPHFADCEFPVAFHCRGCSKIVCWRHASRTDLTGAWCETCAKVSDEGTQEHRGATPRSAIVSNSAADVLIADIRRRNLPHRKGWRPLDQTGTELFIKHLREEVDELAEALAEFQVSISASDCDIPYDRAHVTEELADVFACTLHLAQVLDLPFAELDAEAVRKLRLRFIGAAEIEVPRSHA